MIEIYKDTAERIELKLYLSGDRVNSTAPVKITVTDSKTGEILANDSTAVVTVDSSTKELYSYIVNLDATRQERSLKAVWSYEILGFEGARTDLVDVVTPYVTPDEIISFDPSVGQNFTYEQIKNSEKQIRGIINAFTGQSFGQYHDIKPVIGNNDTRIDLPEKLLTFVGMKSYDRLLDDTYQNFRLRNDGWTVDTTVSVFDDTSKIYTETPVVGGYYRPKSDLFFREDTSYLVEGIWGYERVPSEVNQAALILVQQNLCPESEYRDRYISKISAADWKYEFDMGAYSGTGNVMADQLLWPFRRLSMKVI